MKPKTPRKQKSLGQVAFEADESVWSAPTRARWESLDDGLKRHWHRVARAVVKAANLKPHLNSAAKLKHN